MELILPNDQSSTAAEIIAVDHRYSGQIVTAGRRLADILSDPGYAMLQMQDTLVESPGPAPAQLRCRRLLVAKKDVLMVVPQGGHEAPIRRHNNYQSKAAYPVIVVLPGYMLSAVAHLLERANAWMLIDDSAGLPSFFGLTDVTVHTSPHGLVPSHCDTVIVNRRRIESVELADRPLPKPQPEQPVAASHE